MKANDIIKILQREKGISSEYMGRMIGIKGCIFRRRMQNENPTVESVLEALDALGYELVIQKRRRGRRADGQYVVTREVA